MSWGKIVGHDEIVDRFRTAIRRGRLASTFLFVGPPGIGKRAFAQRLAQALLCESNAEELLEPCEACPGCIQVRAGSHPDVLAVAKPADRSSIPLSLLIGDPQHRNRTGLCHDIGLKPARGKRKVAIIDDADFLYDEAANSLLKTLEEPPPGSVLILIGTSEQRQLNTIVSRSQVVHFRPLSVEAVEAILLENGIVENAVQAAKLALSCNGSVEMAIRLADPEQWDFRQKLFRQLASRDPNDHEFPKAVNDFLDTLGKDATAKRNRLIEIGDQAIDFYRSVILTATNQPLPKSDAATRASELIAKVTEAGFEPADAAGFAADCIDRTIQLQRQVWANVQPVNAIAAWLADLGRICRGEVAGVIR